MPIKLDPQRFDAMVAGVGTASKTKLWGASEIAKVLGCSVHTVYRLADQPDTPVYKPGGRYFALRHELDNWLTQK